MPERPPRPRPLAPAPNAARREDRQATSPLAPLGRPEPDAPTAALPPPGPDPALTTARCDAVLALPGQEGTGAAAGDAVGPTLPFGARLPLPRQEGAAPGALAPGAALGELRLLREAARDAARSTFEADHPRHGRCRVEVLHREHARALGRGLLLEARVLHLLPPSPGRVRVLGLGAEPQVWVAFEDCGAPTLQEVWSASPPTASQVAEVGASLAEALEPAHARGAYHGDLTLADVRVAPSGPRLDGFTRRARVSSLGARVAYLGGPVLGPPHTVAPERFEEDRPTAAADQYSLGCLLYYGLTGGWPFPGDEPAAVKRAATTAPLVAPALTDPLARRLLPIVLRCLARDPEERYRTAADLGRALRYEQEGRPARRRRAAIALVVTALLTLLAVVVTV